eukprot:m.83327 g.83327  ORF g.83327 m.83327 type:complete len:69 (-) comp12719_c0_seq1:3-209(-)
MLVAQAMHHCAFVCFISLRVFSNSHCMSFVLSHVPLALSLIEFYSFSFCALLRDLIEHFVSCAVYLVA